MLCADRKASYRSQSGDMNYDIGASVKAAAAAANRRNLYLRTTPTGTRGGPAHHTFLDQGRVSVCGLTLRHKSALSDKC